MLKEVKDIGAKTATAAPKRRVGRRSNAERDKIRASLGLSVIAPDKRKSNAILPMSKKGKTQQVLAELMGKSAKVIVAKLLEKALNDEDKDQFAAMKLVVDRLIPVSYFEKDKVGKGGVSITISGIGGITVGDAVEQEAEEQDYIDGDVIDGEE